MEHKARTQERRKTASRRGRSGNPEHPPQPGKSDPQRRPEPPSEQQHGQPQRSHGGEPEHDFPDDRFSFDDTETHEEE
jgi:hypothetical protein